MGSERWCAYREGLLAFVAEGDLLLAAAAPMVYFVPTLLGLAIGGMVDLAGGVADVGRLTDKRALTAAPAAIGWLTKVVRARRQGLLARGGCGGLLCLLNCRFANNFRLGDILTNFGLRRRAR